MYNCKCSSTKIAQNCITKTYTLAGSTNYGQTIYITDQKKEIHSDGNSIIKCPDVSGDRRAITWFEGSSPSIKVTNNNISQCSLYRYIFYVFSSEKVHVERNTITKHSINTIYCNRGSIMSILYDNVFDVVGDTSQDIADNCLFDSDGKDIWNVSHSIFISVRLYYLADSPTKLMLDECMFHGCTFKAGKTLMTVATTKPFTNTNHHIRIGECFGDISYGFTAGNGVMVNNILKFLLMNGLKVE